MGSLKLSVLLDSSKTFRAGDCISGRIIVTCLKEKVVENIYVMCVGQTVLRPHSNHGLNVKDRLAPETLFSKSTILLAGNSGQPIVLLGRKEFNFSFILPENLPSSFTAPYGDINYYITAGVEERGLFPNIIKCRESFHVQSIVDLDDYPTAKLPVETKLTREISGFLGSKGNVMTSIKLPKSGYLLGENIPVAIEIDNQSKKKVKLAVIVKRKFLFSPRPVLPLLKEYAFVQSKKWVRHVSFAEGPQVGSGQKIHWNVPDLMVETLPTSSVDLHNGSVVMRYELKVKIYPGGITPLKHKIPLTIGTKSSKFSGNPEGKPQKEVKVNTNASYQPSAPFTFHELPLPSYDQAVSDGKSFS